MIANILRESEISLAALTLGVDALPVERLPEEATNIISANRQRGWQFITNQASPIGIVEAAARNEFLPEVLIPRAEIALSVINRNPIIYIKFMQTVAQKIVNNRSAESVKRQGILST